jgi:signal transduction histidine kinase
MRSLTLKLVLAFVLTSVVGMLLASLLIRQLYTQGFDDYVIDQQRDEFSEIAADYYGVYGSWDGFDRWYRRNSVGPQGGPPPGTQPNNDPTRRRFSGNIRFAIVDTNMVVVFGFDQYQPGKPVDAATVQNGTPLVIDDSIVGTIITPDRSIFRTPAEEVFLDRTGEALVLASSVSIVVAVLLSLLLARLITRPVRDLTAASRRIAAGDLEQQVVVRSRDELGTLATQFNRMSADLAHANQLRRQMTADIAHDLRTPLTVIAGYLESLRDEVLKPTPARFATMYAEVQLLLHLVEDLHLLSMADAGELPLALQPIQPGALLERVASTYYDAAAQQDVHLSLQVAPDLGTIMADPEQVVRALGNLVSNALRHTPAGGWIELRADRTAGMLEFTVADSGEGIAAEHLPNLFERFYRTDSARHQADGGSGLGLAIVRSIAQAHGGDVSVASTPGTGSVFTITLPA